MPPAATKPREKPRLGRAAPVAPDLLTVPIPTKSTVVIDGVSYDLIEIRGTGDVLLEVSFENTSACNRSIPSDTIKELRLKKSEFPSSKVFYRVDLGTLKKHSKFFANLLGSEVFGEGQAVKDAFSRLKLENLKPSEVEAQKLPRVTMVDDEFGTRTLGREAVFLDLLRVLHGDNHMTKPISILYLTVLVSNSCIRSGLANEITHKSAITDYSFRLSWLTDMTVFLPSLSTCLPYSPSSNTPRYFQINPTKT